MKNPLKAMLGKKPKSAAEIETELTKLAGKLADHQRRRSELLQSAEEARAAWRESLADDDDVIATAKARVDQLEREADDAGRTIAEYESAISAAEDRFRVASLGERRRATAAALEATAKKVDAVKTELEKAVAQVAAAARKIMAAIPVDMGVFHVIAEARPGERPERQNEFASNREAVAAVLGEALLCELPELFDFAQVGNYHALGLLAVGDPEAVRVEPIGWSQRDAVGLPAGAAIETLISSRLRDRAGRILAGELDAAGATIKIEQAARLPEPPAETRIIGLRNFRFLDAEEGYKPRARIIAEGTADWICDEAARAAIARGWAASFDSREGQMALGHFQSRKSQRVGPVTVDDCLDLGDPLGLQSAYEVANAAFNVDPSVDKTMAIAGLDRHTGELAMSSPRGS